MKVLTKEQFMSAPYGTLYRTCVNSMFTGDLSIKHEPISEDGKSWWALDISPWLETEMDALLNQPCGEEVKTRAFCTDDAIYNYGAETMYAIFNKQEISDMVDRLNMAEGYWPEDKRHTRCEKSGKERHK
jgi:hypothetical protein